MINMYLDYSLKIINRIKPIENEKIKHLRYILKCIYYIVTKFTIITLLSIILNMFIETLIMNISFVILRMFAQGIHARKNSTCWFITILMFIIVPLLNINFPLNQYIAITLMTFLLPLYLIYSPNDTKKRPLRSKNKRTTYKIISTCIVGLFIIISLIHNNILLSNLLLSTTLITCISFLPITYKIFDEPSYNYKEIKYH